MDIKNQIEKGLTSIGIEFGSTRIKAVLMGKDFSIIGVSNKSIKYEFTNQLFLKSTESNMNLKEKLDSHIDTNK